MRITLSDNIFAYDSKVRIIELESMLDLPRTKERCVTKAECWNPFEIITRAVDWSQDSKIKELTIHHLVYDMDNVDPPEIEYKHYLHKTHIRNWRVIVPLKEVISVRSESYRDLYLDVAGWLGLNKDVMVDDWGSCYYRFFLLPLEENPRTLVEGETYSLLNKGL